MGSKCVVLIIPFFIIIIASCAIVEELRRPSEQQLPTNTISIARTTLAQTRSMETPTATLDAIQILSIKDAMVRTKSILEVNGGCELPCIWGITPGVTTFDQAKRLLAPLSNLYQFSLYEVPNGEIDLLYPIEDLQVHIGIRYINNPTNPKGDQTVYSILYSLGAQITSSVQESPRVRSVYDSAAYSSLTEFYSLRQVLERLGVPDIVELQTISQYARVIEGVQQPSEMHLILIYLSEGILAEYVTQISIEDGIVRGCFDSPQITFDVRASGNRTLESFSSELNSNRSDLLLYYLPIDQATSYSVAAFTEHYSQMTDSCITTPARLWPRPD